MEEKIMEEKILNSFVKKMKGEVNKEDLLVFIPDCFGDDNEYYCEVMEKWDNGKVWEVETTRSCNVKDIYEL